MFSGCGSGIMQKKMPKAVNGFIDLSNWDFDSDGVVKLNGQWEFYWMKHYSPADFVKGSYPHVNISQPRSWTNQKINGKSLPNYGYATYRLKIKINPKYTYRKGNHPILGLKLVEAHSSYKLWIDTSIAIQNGQPSTNPAEFKPKIKPEYCSFYSYGDTLVVIINVANYFDKYMAGIDDIIQLGNSKNIIEESHNNEFLFISSLSIFLTIGFYHFVLYFIRRKDKINLVFSFICLLFAIQAVCEGEKTIFYLIPSLSEQIYCKLWASTLLIFPLLVSFYRHLFPNEINKHFMRIFAGIFGLFFVIVWLTSYSFFVTIFSYFLYVGTIVMAYIFWSILVAIKNKRPYSVYIFISMLIPFIAAVNDILFGLDLIVTAYYGPLGFLVLILTHSAVVSIRFARSYEKVEKLSGELNELNQSLEKKVEERTKELSAAYSELKETNATKNKIFSIIAHDLKNIFQAVLGYSEILEFEVQQGDMGGIAQSTKVVKETSKKAYLFFENLLEWSSSQTGLIKFKPENINVNGAIKECADILFTQSSAKGISIIITAPEDLMVYADKRMLATIIRNLISNAIKFSYRGGNVYISAVELNGRIEIAVRDEGVGIKKEKLADLFKVDRLQSSKGTDSEDGTGLGLLLIKEFIKNNNGELFISSELGRGSEFKFTLPNKA